MIDLENYRDRIDIIKLSVSALITCNLRLNEIIDDTFDYLDSLFMSTSKKEYLFCALLFIQSFYELGADLSKHSNFIKRVFEFFNIEGNDILYNSTNISQVIRINKAQIRTMIRQWTPNKKNPLSITEVVNDIYDKLSSNKHGTYQYICYHPDNSFDLYELIIHSNERFFHDVRRKKYFTFK